MEQHAAAAAAAAGLHPTRRQLLQAQYMLASWIDRHEHDAGPLPSPLDHGPVELLRSVMSHTNSPHASAKLLDDAVILLMYGASFLQDRYDATRSRDRVEAFARQQHAQRERWTSKATSIQATWRTQRFHTNRLPVLELTTGSYLQPQVAELMRRKRLEPQDSLANLSAVPVRVDPQELEKQVVKYADELRKRVEARRRDQDELERRQLKEQHLQEEKRKRMIVQRKKRHEHACRRWHFFTTRLLRLARQNKEGEAAARSNSVSGQTQADSNPTKSLSKKNVDRAKSMLRAFKNPGQHTLVRRFVAKLISRGISRVLCSYNMRQEGMGLVTPSDIPSPSIQETDASTTTTSSDTVLRLGLLLCDLHFGVKYSGLYQRYFDRAAHQRGIRVQWHVFNCLKSQFPTKAHTRILNGYLVAGGPNIGTVNEMSRIPSVHGPSLGGDPLEARQRVSFGTKKNPHFGRWRPRLLMLLRELHARRQTLLGGLGLGHVLLAEALGARVGMREWEDGWCLLDPTIFTSVSPHYLDRRYGQGMLGIRFLHGEFVQSFANEKNGHASGRHGFKSWRSPGDHNFVSCFRDTLTLSIDGSPECGPFVFETLSEFYDRDRAYRTRHNKSQSTIPLRSTECGDLCDDEDNEDDEDDDFVPVVLDTALSLEEKRKRMGITDASGAVAHLFLDHFRRQVVSTTKTSPASAVGDTMAIAGVMCSSNVLQVDASVQHLMSLDGIGGIFMNVSASTDGHLMVTNPKAYTLIVDHDKRVKDQQSKQRSSVGAHATGRRNSIFRPPALTLAMVRDQERMLQGAQSPSSNNLLSPRTVHLPSIRPDCSHFLLSENSLPTKPPEQNRRGLVRRTSTLASSRLAQTVSSDGASVLTLSQALALIAARQTTPKRVFIRLLDEECKQTHDLLPITTTELRTLWLRLLAALRIADLRGEQIGIVSRHSFVLDYIKRRRPIWTFVKDCRRSEVTHRKRVKKIAQYAAYADIVLFDQDFLLSNSANENDVLLQRAKSIGLEVYVAQKDESPKVSTAPPEKISPRRSQSRLVKKPSSRGSSYRRLSREITAKTTQGDSEYDMQVVEFMLLQFSGLDGVITPNPDAALDAQQRIAAKNEAMQQVEQLFRDWQAKDTTKVTSPKRSSTTPPQLDPTLDEDDPDDYVGADSHYDSGDSLPEHEVADEMARQMVEHSYTGTPTAVVSTGSFGRGAGGSVAMLAGSPLPVAAPVVPLRPLQPKSGDEVFGAGAIRRQSTARSLAASPSSNVESRGRLSSIGSFRAALRRTSSGTPTQSRVVVGDDSQREECESRDDVRAAERTSSPLSSTRSLKAMSTRRILAVPR